MAGARALTTSWPPPAPAFADGVDEAKGAYLFIEKPPAA